MHKKSRRMKLIFALTLALFVVVALAAPALAAAEGAPAPEAAQTDNSLGLKEADKHCTEDGKCSSGVLHFPSMCNSGFQF